MNYNKNMIRDFSPLSLKMINDNFDNIYIHKLEAYEIKTEGLIVGKNIAMGPKAFIAWGNVTGTENIPLRSDIDWNKLSNKPTDLLTQSQLIVALAGYVTDGKMTTALANTLNTTNFSTIITKSYIASMNLVVGKEILMGANARISWLNVDNKPTLVTDYSQLTSRPYIPPEYHDSQAVQAWANSGYKTYIDSSGVYTGTVIAERIMGGSISGCTLRTVSNGQKGIVLQQQYLDAVDASNISRLRLGWDSLTPFIRLGADDIYAFKISNSGGVSTIKSSANGTNLTGSFDFSSATVTGLSAVTVVAKFG